MAGLDQQLRVERKAPPVRTQVVENLRAAILEMRLQPGQRLIERELVDATGVSRTSIREALRELAAEGLVRTIPNHGTVVAAVTREEAEQIYELRSSLEALAGKLFVERASDKQFDALQSAFVAIEKAYERRASVPVIVGRKDAFYDALFAGAGNEVLRQVVAGLHARVTVLRTLSLSQSGRGTESLEELRAIVTAALGRDDEATAEACRRHVEAAGRTCISALGVGDPDAGLS